MPAGGILRQALRLSATSAVRGILSSVLSNNESIFGSEINSTKYEAIRKFIKNKSTNVEFKDQLLQTMDLQRLKNLIYRDMEEVEQAQFLALSVVYFLSVLLAAYCGDILEPCNDKLQKSIEPVISLLREILCDFRSFLQKTLLGTHGQEIMNDKVMHTLKNVSVIEILCSQEWQTSLQKHFELEFMELVNEGFILSVPNKILGQFKMSSLPPEIQFDVLKCLDFEQLFFLYQNNFYFYNLINLYEGVLARKKFCSFSLTGAIFSSHHILKSNEVPSFILNDQLKEKWQTALEESITLFLQPDTTDPLQPARPFFSLFSHGPRRVKNVFVELRLKDFFILKLPNYPKTIEELIIIRSWLEQLFDCGFGNAVFGDIIFNPQMIDLLFDNDKIKKFNVHSLTLHTQNITDNILDFALNRFAIYLSFNINFASGNTDILFNIINEGKKVPHVIFTNCQSSEFYNRVIKVSNNV
ncbi:unnamed protein product [Meloidogyne enterolobii]|uniref:Uncharacterized protein n=1 Tax=Meloidogyne enterolobii TaxID=390850 RepID=A0ACB1AQC9_MELEN